MRGLTYTIHGTGYVTEWWVVLSTDTWFKIASPDIVCSDSPPRLCEIVPYQLLVVDTEYTAHSLLMRIHLNAQKDL